MLAKNDELSQLLEWSQFSKWKMRKLQREYLYKECLNSKGSILNVGSGSGRLERLLLRKGRDVIGVDISFGLLEKAKEITNGQFVQGNALHIPFKNDSQDVVILEEVIEHFNNIDQKKIIHEAYRILKENGKAIISTPNRHVYGWIMRLNQIRKLNLRFSSLKQPVPGHIGELDLESLKKLLGPFFKEKVKIRGINPYLPGRVMEKYINLSIGFMVVCWK